MQEIGASDVATRMRGGVAAVKALETNGVDTVFGIPGVHTLEIYDALIDSNINHILARHEQGAGFMADGYARASGKPGVAVIITGPGITNVATPIGEAYTDSVPVLVLSSNVEREWADKMLGHLHDLSDQLGVMAAVTKWNERALSVDTIPHLLNTAFQKMTYGRPRPTHVEIPIDVLAEFADVNVAAAPALNPPAPDAKTVTQALDLVESSNRIVIYCGGGAQGGAGKAIESLAERLGAPVLMSAMGKGAISDRHPLSLGNNWERGNAVDDLLKTADLAIVFGSKLGAQETDYQRMPVPEKLIRVEIDDEEVLRNYAPTVPVVADSRKTAEALLDGLSARKITRQCWSADEVQQIKASALEQCWGSAQQPYVDALRNAIPDDGILVNDMTMMAYVNNRRYPVYEPRTYFFPSGYGTLGYSLPAAIGAKVACPDKTVVAVMGDGGFQYTMQELATAAQFEINLPIVIFNDSTYTAVKEAQAAEHDRRFIAVDLKNPDFVSLANAYGIASVRAESPADLQSAIESAADHQGPTLIDTPIQVQFN
jgi:thiamine pyrophosphate-dependent acetolactate synthase large subunit-like protein